MSTLKVGDLVEVLDEGLAMLRRVCPDMPPNHHGRVSEVNGDQILVEFPIDGSYEGHSQAAPYPVGLVRKRELCGLCGDPMPEGESMFKYHGHSGPCPKPPKQATAGPAWTDIAASAYRSYAASTGNKNFRGEPMPAYQDLPVAIRTAWEAAARQVGDILSCPRTAFENEQSWAGWVSPSA